MSCFLTFLLGGVAFTASPVLIITELVRASVYAGKLTLGVVARGHMLWLLESEEEEEEGEEERETDRGREMSLMNKPTDVIVDFTAAQGCHCTGFRSSRLPRVGAPPHS